MVPGLSINAQYVADMKWEHRHYINGSESTLVITMNDGRTHRVQGEEAYALEKQIKQDWKHPPTRDTA